MVLFYSEALIGLSRIWEKGTSNVQFEITPRKNPNTQIFFLYFPIQTKLESKG